MEYPDGLNREQWLELIEERRNPFYEYPANLDQRIWRYMDFTKFMYLIDSKELFFPSAAVLNDPFEGSVSRENLRQRPFQQEQVVEGIRAAFMDKPGFFDQVEKQLRTDLHQSDLVRSRQLEWERNWTFISCWHLNDHESAAMWKLYASNNHAIAIQSTFKRFHACLQNHFSPPLGEPKLGKVKYADYDKEIVPRNVHLSEFFYKRKSFEHEAELRAVFQDLPQIPVTFDSNGNAVGWHFDYSKPPIKGISLSINIEQLVEAIYIAPSAPDWLTKLVANVLSKYGFKKPIHNSALDARPVY